jgi:hypothetical protein
MRWSSMATSSRLVASFGGPAEDRRGGNRSATRHVQLSMLTTRPRDVGVTSSAVDRPSLLEQLAQTRTAVEAHEKAEARAFRPAEMPEALILRVIGGWQNFLGEVNRTRFHAAGAGACPLQKRELAKGMREVADALRVRWPHQQWSAAVAKAKLARHELAHMLYIFSVTGEMPNRTINIARLGKEGKPREAHDGSRWRRAKGRRRQGRWPGPCRPVRRRRGSIVRPPARRWHVRSRWSR